MIPTTPDFIAPALSAAAPVTPVPVAPRISTVKPSELVVDPAVQRALNKARTQKMADAFDPASVGVVTVSERDSNLYVVDGQHRVEAAKAAGHGDTPIDAKIYTGLTRADEARLFIALNSARVPDALARFRVRLEAEDPTPMAIVKILRRYGWNIGSPGVDGSVGAVSALENLYNLDPGEDRGLFNAAVNLITMTWGHNCDAVSAPILGGVGQFLDRFGTDLDFGSLAKKAKSEWTSPVELVARGRSYQAARGSGGKLSRCVAEVLHAVYNSKRRASALPPW